MSSILGMLVSVTNWWTGVGRGVREGVRKGVRNGGGIVDGA